MLITRYIVKIFIFQSRNNIQNSIARIFLSNIIFFHSKIIILLNWICSEGRAELEPQSHTRIHPLELVMNSFFSSGQISYSEKL